VVVGDSNVDLEDLTRLEGFQDIPATVGGAVDVGVVVAALPKQVRRGAGQARSEQDRTGQYRPGQSRAGRGKVNSNA